MFSTNYDSNMYYVFKRNPINKPKNYIFLVSRKKNVGTCVK